MKCQIHYKAIFKDQSKDDFVCDGLYEYKNHFHHIHIPDKGMSISHNDHTLILKNQNTRLEIKNTLSSSMYHTDYGDILMESKLIKIKSHKESVKSIYELYQGGELLVRVYLTISLSFY